MKHSPTQDKWYLPEGGSGLLDLILALTLVSCTGLVLIEGLHRCRRSERENAHRFGDYLQIRAEGLAHPRSCRLVPGATRCNEDRVDQIIFLTEP